MSVAAQILAMAAFLVYSFLYLAFVAWASDPARPSGSPWSHWFRPAVALLALLFPGVLLLLLRL